MKPPRSVSPAAALFAVALLPFPRVALAWSRLGHQTIGQIAQDQLKNASDPASQTALASVKTLLNTSSDQALADLAPCADSLRAQPASPPMPATPTKPASPGYPGINPGDPVKCGGLDLVANSESAPWHFINIPLTAQAAPGSVSAYCPGGACVVDEIKRNVQVLSDGSASVSDKQIALMYLSHFVGDEHQPLHCTTEIVDGQDDRGGNGKPVKLDGTQLNLHALWDHQIEVKDDYPVDLSALESMPGDADQWAQGDFVTAAAVESFTIGKDTIYPSYYQAAAAAADHVPDYGAAYQTQMQAITNKRLQMAGFRLAALIKQALGGQPLSASASKAPASNDPLETPKRKVSAVIKSAN